MSDWGWTGATTGAEKKSSLPPLPSDESKEWGWKVEDPATDIEGHIFSSPDPENERAKIESAKTMAGILGVSPAEVLKEYDYYVEAWSGAKEKPVLFWDRLKNTLDAIALENQINQLSVRQMTGDKSPELQERIEELQKKVKPEQFGALPKGLLNIGNGLIYQAITGADFLAYNVAGFLSGEYLYRAVGGKPATNIMGEAAGLGERFTGTFAGAAYRGARDLGVDDNIATGAALGVGVLQAATMGLKISKIPGVQPLAEKAVMEAAKKAALNGAMKTQLLQTGKRLLGSTVEQGLLGGLGVSIDVVGRETAIELHNMADKGQLTHTQADEILKEIGLGVAVGGVAGLAASIPGSMQEGGRISKMAQQLAHEKADSILNVSGAERFAVSEPRPEMSTEGRRAAYDKDMVEARAKMEELKSRLRSAKPEEKSIIEADLLDFNKKIETPFEEKSSVFSENIGDQNVGDVLRAQEFGLEQEREIPATPKIPPVKQEKFGFADMTPEQVKDEAQQLRMFEKPQTAEDVQTSIVAPEIAPPEPFPSVTQFDTNKIPVQEVPLDKLRLSKDVPNFKEGANAQGVIEPLAGSRYERLGTAPIIVWERIDGTMEVITGRHRYDLAVRSGEKSIPAQIVREANGFTAAQAMVFDAESNIRDGQGSVRDYANYFRSSKITEEQASGRGLLARDKGRKGFAIGQYAADGLYTLYRNGEIGEQKAAAIAAAAPLDEPLQAAGIQKAREFSADELSNYVNILKNQSVSSGVNFDLFGRDDTVLVEAAKVAKEASKKMGELRDENAALKSAFRLGAKERAALVEKYGFKTGDRAAVEARIGELEGQIAEWSNWYTDSAKVRELRERAGLSAEAAPIQRSTKPIEAGEPTRVETPRVEPKKAGPVNVEPEKPFIPEAVQPQNEPMTATDFENYLNRDPSYDRAVAEIKRVEEKIRAKAGTPEELNAELKSATDRANEVANAVKEDWKHRIAVARAKREGGKSVNKMIERIKRIDPADYPDEYRDAIKEAIDGFSTIRHTEKTLARLEKIRKMLAENPNAEVARKDLDRLSNLGKTPLRDLSVDDLKTVYNAVMVYAKLARDEKFVKVGTKKMETGLAIQKATIEIPSRKKIEDRMIRSRPSAKKALQSTARGVADFFGVDSTNFDRLAEMCGDTVYKTIFEGPHEGNKARMKYMQDRIIDYHNDIAPILERHGDLSQWIGEEFASGEVTLADGTKKPLVLTRAERMSLYMHAKNPQNRKHLLKGGFGFKWRKGERDVILKIDPETLNAITKSLTPDEIAYTKAADTLLKRTGLDLDDTFYRLNDIHLELGENYYHIETMPAGRGRDAESEMAFDIHQSDWARVGLFKGMTISRVEGASNPIYLNPITYDLNRSLEHAAAYIGLEENLRTASRLLDKVKAPITERLGERTYQDLLKGLKDIAGMRDNYGVLEDAALTLRNNIAVATLGINAPSFLKQMLGLTHYSMYVKSKYLVQAFVDTTMHPKAVDRTHRIWSPEYVDRAEHGPSREVADVLKQSGYGTFFGGKRKWQGKMMAGMQYFDRWTVKRGMQGAVLQALDEIGEGHLSPQVANALQMTDADLPRLSTPEAKMEAAYKFADYATERTQNMAQPEFMSTLQRGGAAEKMITLFASEASAAMNMRRRAFEEAKKAGTPQAWARLTKVMFVTLALDSMGSMMIDRARREAAGQKNDDIKKDIAYSLASQAVSGLPIVRDVANPMLRKGILGRTSGSTSILPIQRAVDNVVETGMGLIDIADAESVRKRAKAIGKTADALAESIGLLAGLPYGPVRTMVKTGIKLLKK